jgi:hypothetical protein
MSKSPLSNLPENIRLVPEAVAEFLRLDRGRQLLVLGGLCKIARDPVHVGAWLGNRGKGKNRVPLVTFRKMRIDKGDLRIIWTVPKDGSEYIEAAIIVSIGRRADEEVYALAATRLQSAIGLREEARKLHRPSRSSDEGERPRVSVVYPTRRHVENHVVDQ